MLVLHDLHKAFGEVRALDACSFAVGRGGMLGFLGPLDAGSGGVRRGEAESNIGAPWDTSTSR